MSASPVGFDYPALLRGSLLGMVRGLLGRVAEEGFPGDHHFLLTFATSEPGVVMSPGLRQRYPEEMTIVLQHQFWNLGTDGAGFWVTLRFSGQPEPLTVPWVALRAFADPSVEFGLRFQPITNSEAGPPAAASPEESLRPESESLDLVEEAESGRSPRSNVIDFGAHRRGEDGKA